MVRRARPDVFLHHFIHIPWTQSDSWRVLPRAMREELFGGLLANDIIGFHTSSYRRNFLQCCEDLLDLDVDHAAGIVHHEGRDVWVRSYPLPIDARATQALGRSARVAQFEAELERRRATTSSSGSTARTCPRTSCAASRPSTCSSTSTPSSASA
jgi:trehalose 6-phosphate synthase